MEQETKPKKTLEELMESSVKLTPVVLSDLEQSFYADFTITQACLTAGITRETYYQWLEASDEFAARMAKAQNDLFMKARKILRDKVDNGDNDTAKWLLERRDKRNYSSRTELTGDDGAPLNPDTQEIKKIGEDLQQLLKNGNTKTDSEPGQS